MPLNKETKLNEWKKCEDRKEDYVKKINLIWTPMRELTSNPRMYNLKTVLLKRSFYWKWWL